MHFNNKIGLLILIIAISIFAGSGVKTEEKDDFNEYSSIHYTFQYPSSWEEPVSITKPLIGGELHLSRSDDELSMKVMTTRIYPYEEPENYIAKSLKKIDDLASVSDFKIDNNTAYEVKFEENNELFLVYVYSEKDMVFEIQFECQLDKFNSYKSEIEKILGSFKVNEFEALNSLDEKWNKYSAGHLEVFYPDDSDIYGKVEDWTQIRVEAFNYISEYLGVQWKYEPVKVFVFNSKEHGRQFGIELGFAVSGMREVYTEDTQSPGHELAHCISYWICNGERIDSDLVNEGLATYLNMMGTDNHRLSLDEIGQMDYSIELLGESFWEHKNAYIYGASFVQYLIDEYGLDVFKNFFAQNDLSEEDSFRMFYNKEGEELLSEWIDYLKTY